MTDSLAGRPPRCALVSVLYNSVDCMAAFAASLQSQGMADWRLFAIDNASSDGSADMLRALDDDRIGISTNSRNLGFAKAANQGLRAALASGADHIILINNDISLQPDFLSRFLGAWDDLKAEVIAPRIMHEDAPDRAWYAGGHLHYDWAFRNVHDAYDPNDPGHVRVVDFASGCCLSLTRTILQRVGLLDERFFVYWEDTDFCLRLKVAQVPIHYVGDVTMLHRGGHASGGENSPVYNRLYWCSYTQLIRKHFGYIAAIRNFLRIVAKEAGRTARKTAPLKTMTLAMLKGLLIPSRPLPKVQKLSWRLMEIPSNRKG
jgi:GT2 family glycosyltransferase